MAAAKLPPTARDPGFRFMINNKPSFDTSFKLCVNCCFEDNSEDRYKNTSKSLDSTWNKTITNTAPSCGGLIKLKIADDVPIHKGAILPNSRHMNSILKSLAELWKMSEAEMRPSMTEEESGLINTLKQKADELLVRCEAVQKVNTELEARAAGCQKDLEHERKKSATLEKRFAVLAANNQAIIVFKDEYKKQNAQLRQENEVLLSENKTLFSQKLEDKEALVQKLQQELQQLSENYMCLQSQLQEEAAQHQSKEASLRDRLHQAQQQHKDAVELCKDLKLQLQKSEEKHALLEQTMNESIESLKKDKDNLLHLTTEHEKTMQEKQQEMQQLETKCKEETTAKLKAEDRFEREAAAVKKDAKVKSLQSALDESQTQYNKLKMDFEAFKEHMTDLLAQERELNATLRHMNY